MRGSLPLVLLVVAATSAATRLEALPVIVQETRLLVHLDVLPVATDETGVAPLASRSVEIPAGASVVESLSLRWPEPEATTALRLDLAGTAGPEGGEHEIRLDARLDLPGDRTVASSRNVRVREGSTQILDLFSDRGRRLLLAVRAERTTRAVALVGPRAGAQVRFRLDVARVEEDRSVPLESNVMDTFLGQGVEYAFRRGEGDELESMRVVLTPVRLEGEIAEIAVEVTGSLPGSPSRVVLSRSERLVSTRGAASSITVLAGAGPSGYRFTITPDF